MKLPLAPVKTHYSTQQGLSQWSNKDIGGKAPLNKKWASKTDREPIAVRDNTSVVFERRHIENRGVENEDFIEQEVKSAVKKLDVI